MRDQQARMSLCAEVVPVGGPRALSRLTYLVPNRLADTLRPGIRVLVPLGRRKVTAVVAQMPVARPDGIHLREITDSLDTEPVVPADIISLADWTADYYLSALPETLALALGKGLMATSSKLIHLIDPAAARNDNERRIVELLESSGGCADQALIKRRLTAQQTRSALRSLEKRGAIKSEDTVRGPRVRERYDTIAEVTADPGEELEAELFSRAPKRRRVWEHLSGLPGRRASMADLTESLGPISTQVRELEKAGLLARVRQEVYRELDLVAEQGSRPELSPEQELSVETVRNSLGGFEAFMLHGVTGSGKTEVYLRLIEETLERGLEAIVLVPEISLTHQVVGRLMARFGPTVAVLHSELGAGERWDQWRRLCRREARIAVGARSAVMAPVAQLGLMVVDEEHDPAYKQGDGVRYNGRDLAVVRARQSGCPVVLASATPSLETWANARSGRYRTLELPHRVSGGQLPRVEVVDLRGRDITALGGLSEHLARELESNHESGGQSLLFLNRRGWAGSVQCYQCGNTIDCDGCSVALKLHKHEGRLRCHHCDRSRPLPELCPDCSGDSLLATGLGTQRLERSVGKLLPGARVARLDRDTASAKGGSAEILEAWRNGDIDVLVGTQMVTKGHDVAGVTLVGVVQADFPLCMPDFRGAERTFQLLCQVAGRAGRGQRPGRVIVQTYRPEHPAVRAAVTHDYPGFADGELEERRELAYPPHTRMTVVRFEGTNEQAVSELATRAAAVVTRGSSSWPDLVLRGPAPSPIAKLRSRYRYQLQLRDSDPDAPRQAAAALRSALASEAHKARVHVLIDVDPFDMM